MNLPEMNEDNAKPGTRLTEYAITYDDEAIGQYLARSGEAPDAYVVDGVMTVPPGMFLGAYGRLIHGSFHYETGVHTASEMSLHRCPPVGTEAMVRGEILRTFERNGDKYVTFSVRVESAATNERFAEIEHTSIYKLRSRATATA